MFFFLLMSNLKISEQIIIKIIQGFWDDGFNDKTKDFSNGGHQKNKDNNKSGFHSSRMNKKY